MSRRSSVVILLSLLLSGVALSGAVLAAGRAGTLDTSFGTEGKVLTDFSGSGSSDAALAVAIQADGKIVAVGGSNSGGSEDFALARYMPDGALDASFGTGGKVLTDFSGSGSHDAAPDLAIQRDGKIVAVGGSNSGGSEDFALARYMPDGALDASFGTGGKVLTDFSGSGSNESATSVAIQADGKIVAAGPNEFPSDFALARYNLDGALDTSFGTGGKVLTDFSGSGSHEFALAVAIQADGKIVAAGVLNEPPWDFALARYNTDGTLDTSFGSGGKVLTDFGGLCCDEAFEVAIQRDGKILAVGESGASGSFDFALARYNLDGALDASFGTGGKVLTDISGSGSSEGASNVVFQRNGRIVAAGLSNASGSFDFALARYMPDGALDSMFGTGGTVLTDFSGSGSADFAFDVAIQRNGRIVAAGFSGPELSEDFALARYHH